MLQQFMEWIMDLGFTPSAACWEDEYNVYACSVQMTGRTAYDCPQCSFNYFKHAGILQLYVNN